MQSSYILFYKSLPPFPHGGVRHTQLARYLQVALAGRTQQNNPSPAHQSRRKGSRTGHTFQLFALFQPRSTRVEGARIIMKSSALNLDSPIGQRQSHFNTDVLGSNCRDAPERPGSSTDRARRSTQSPSAVIRFCCTPLRQSWRQVLCGFLCPL
jgi:hypothetical protein